MPPEYPMNINIRVPAALHKKFIGRCARTGSTSSHVLRQLMQAYADGKITYQLTTETTKS